MEAPVTTRASILIADDDIKFARSFQKSLRANGIISQLASTASEATALAQQPPDLQLVFVDSESRRPEGLLSWGSSIG